MKKVTLLAHGGLGNQLFQYAAARSLSESVSVLSYGGDWGSAHPSLSDFGICVTYPNRFHRTITPGIHMRESWRDEVSNSIAKSLGRLSRAKLITQAHPFAEQPNSIERRGHLILNGYFQHRSWWQETWRNIAMECAVSAPHGFYDFQRTRPTIIKLRQSDYLKLGWALNLDWLRQAFMALELRDQIVYVVTEDSGSVDFAAPVLKEFNCIAQSLPTFTSNRNIDDFWTIAAGSKVITSNSSFAWWAAAIAGIDSTAKVVYPRPWLPNIWSTEPLSDFGLPGWIPIDAANRFLLNLSSQDVDFK